MPVIIVYVYLCLNALCIGAFVGYKGFPPSRDDMRSPIVLLLMLFIGPAPLFVLWIQESYGFTANQTHIYGVGLSFIISYLFSSWAKSNKIKSKIVSCQLSRFDSGRLMISTAIIGAVTGAIVAKITPDLSLKVYFPDNYTWSISFAGFIFGSFVSVYIVKIMAWLVSGLFNRNLLIRRQLAINLITILGFMSSIFAIFLDKRGLIIQGIALSLMGVPKVAVTIIKGIGKSG